MVEMELDAADAAISYRGHKSFLELGIEQ